MTYKEQLNSKFSYRNRYNYPASPNATVTGLGTLGDPVIDISTGYIYCSATESTKVVNPKTNTVLTTIALLAYGGTYVPSINRIYSTLYNSRVVSVINPNTYAITTTFNLADGDHRGAEYASSVDRVCFCNTTNNYVEIVNPASNAIVTTIASGATPCYLVWCPDNSYLYCISGLNASAGKVTVMNLTSNTVVTTISIGTTGLTCGTYDSINKKLFVSEYAGTKITAINIVTNTVLTTITVSYSNYVAYHPGANRLYAQTAASVSSVTNPVNYAISGTFATSSAIYYGRYNATSNTVCATGYSQGTLININPHAIG